MICNKLFVLCVTLIVLVSFSCSLSQMVDTGVETTDVPTETEEPSKTICTLCACADSIVNCTNLNISAPFELTDWDGLASFKPITVDLSGNPLISVTRIGKLPIQLLNLSNTAIEVVEDASFIYLEDLKSLDLSRNKISTTDLSRKVFCIPYNAGIIIFDVRTISSLLGPLKEDGPGNFKQMESLSLAYNDIHSLPSDVFTFMTTLKNLDLSGNPLAYIDQVTLGALTELTNLRFLSLSGCELETLPDGLLRRQRKLKRLDLSVNRFTTIPAVLQEAPKLIFLNLEKNAIQALDSNTALSNLTNLQELKLSRMSRLQNITAGALGGLSSLTILQLCHNPRLTNLDPNFLVSEDEDGEDHWPPLKELYLNNNNLTTINSHFLENWNDLEVGDYSNNPYVCDCNSQWMVDVLTPLLINSPQNGTLKNMVCKKPADVRGLTLAQLNEASKTLVCAASENLSDMPTVSNLAIILGIMIGIIVTFPIVLILVLLWKKGYFARCRDRSERKQSYPGYYDEENERL